MTTVCPDVVHIIYGNGVTDLFETPLSTPYVGIHLEGDGSGARFTFEELIAETRPAIWSTLLHLSGSTNTASFLSEV